MMSAVQHTLRNGATERELWPDAVVEPLRVRRAPLLTAALCFAAGVVMARQSPPTVLLVIALTLLAGLFVLGMRHRAIGSLVAVSAIWVVIGLWSAELQPAPPTQARLIAYADGLSRLVQGHIIRVRELPATVTNHDEDVDRTTWIEDQDPGQTQTLSVDLAVDAIEDVTPEKSWMTSVQGGVRLTIIGAPHGLQCGDALEVPLRLKVPERYRNPGAWQYADLLLDQGVGTHASVKAAALTIVPEHRTRWSPPDLKCKLFAAQSWAADQMTYFVHSAANRLLPKIMRLSSDDAGMLNAMLFGDRTQLSHVLRLGFERTGSFHLFVVSGMHVALLAGAVFWMMRRVRAGEITASLLTILLTSAYALLTGFGAPVQRALVMATVFLLARLLSRERSVLNALGAAVLSILIWSPRSLFEASFQMTFLAILAIAGIAVPLGERSFVPYARATRKIGDTWLDVGMPPRLAQFRVMLRVWAEALRPFFGGNAKTLPATALRTLLWTMELGLIGIIAELIMVLPMAVYFHRATVFALPANMFSIPLVAVLAPLAVLTFLTSLISPWLALLPGATTAALLHGMIWLIQRVSHARLADSRVPGPALWIACTALLAWMFCCWAVRRSGRWSLIAVPMLPLIALVILWPEAPLVRPGSLEMTAIDVGQGDSLFLVSPTGQTMLLDAGGPTGAIKETADTTSSFDVGEEVVAPYLWSRQIRRLDVLALSHAHSDHMGGMAAVMRNFRPREFWISIDPDSAAFRNLLLEATELGIIVRHLHAGNTISWGGASLNVLAPEADFSNPGAPGNNDSLVLSVQFGKASILLEGDAEGPSERAMLAAGSLHPVTLLKVGHHGSRTSTSELFYQAVSPRDALISVGRNNTFGHPRIEIINRIAAAHTHLYRTDEFGLTTFLLERDGSIREVLGAGDKRGLFQPIE